MKAIVMTICVACLSDAHQAQQFALQNVTTACCAEENNCLCFPQIYALKVVFSKEKGQIIVITAYPLKRGLRK